MRADIVTIFPDMFPAPMSASIVGIARERGALELHVHDLRDYTDDLHRTTDDAPYGGGPGMVMKPEPIFRAVRAVSSLDPVPPLTVFLTPVGVPFDQALAEELVGKPRLLLVCGRYEGFDERAYELADLRVSIGDYVLSGGELPAMVLIDAVARLLPGVLGDEASAVEESFANGLLEYPQYTRPAEFEGMAVPEVLRSGDHARIATWRRREALRATARFRPDLLNRAAITPEERDIVTETTGDEDDGAE